MNINIGQVSALPDCPAGCVDGENAEYLDEDEEYARGLLHATGKSSKDKKQHGKKQEGAHCGR